MKETQHTKTLKLCTGALLLAAGILLPQVFHMIGGQAMGGMFLPMHLPVFVAGLLLGAVLRLRNRRHYSNHQLLCHHYAAGGKAAVYAH